MLTFKQFIKQVHVYLGEKQYLVNRGIGSSGGWQLREPGDHARPAHIANMDLIILEDAKPWIDQRGIKAGEKIVAYVRGDKVSEKPTGEGRTIMFSFADMPRPFRYADTKEEYKGSEYAVFDGKNFTVYESLSESLE